MIELLVVISVIIILASMTLAAAGFLQRMAAVNRTKAQIKQIESVCAQYNTDWGYYPVMNYGPLPSEWFDSENSKCLKRPNGRVYLDWVGAGFSIGSGYCLDSFDEPIYYAYPGIESEVVQALFVSCNKESIAIWSKGYDQKFGDGGSSITDSLTVQETDDINNWSKW